MHKTAFFLFVCRVAVPFPGLERLIVQSLKLLFYGGISLFKREEVIIPDGGKDQVVANFTEPSAFGLSSGAFGRAGTIAVS